MQISFTLLWLRILERSDKKLIDLLVLYNLEPENKINLLLLENLESFIQWFITKDK